MPSSAGPSDSRLAGDGAAVVAEVFGQLHVDGAAASDHGVVLHGPPNKNKNVNIKTCYKEV